MKNLSLIIALLVSIPLFTQAATFEKVTSTSGINTTDKYILVFYRNNQFYQLGAHSDTYRKTNEISGITITDGEIPETLEFDITEGTNKSGFYPIQFIENGDYYNLLDVNEDKYIAQAESNVPELQLIERNNGNSDLSIFTVSFNDNGQPLIKLNSYSRYIKMYNSNSNVKLYANGQLGTTFPYLYKYVEENSSNPSISVSSESLEFNESTTSNTIDITGKDLDEDISLSITGNGFSTSTNSISKDSGTTTITVSYSGTESTSGTLTLTSGSLSVSISLVASFKETVIEETLAFSSTTGSIYKTGKAIYANIPTLTCNGSEDLANYSITYSSSDESIVSINSDGTLNVHDITNGSSSATVTITAKSSTNAVSYNLTISTVAYSRVKDSELISQNEEFVIVGQRAENSFGILDLSKISDKKATYTESFSSLPEIIFGERAITYIDKDSYIRSGIGDNTYLYANGTDTDITIGEKNGNFNISNNENYAFAIASSANSSRYLLPRTGTNTRYWGLFTKSYSYTKDAYVNYLYRKSLNITSSENGHIVLSGEWDSEIFSVIDKAYPKATSYDLTAVTGSIDGLSTTNKNCLFIVEDNTASQNVLTANNVVVKSGTSYSASNIVLSDGDYPFCSPINFIANEISYNRNYVSGYISTICLPFSTKITSDCSVYEPSECTNSNGSTTIVFCLSEENKIEAYKPYLINANGTVFSSLKDITVEATDINIENKTTVGNFSLVGTMSREKLCSSSSTTLYGFSKGEVGRIGTEPEDSCYINPFKAYVAINNESGLSVMLKAEFKNVSTFISKTTSDDKNKLINVYDINGVLLKRNVRIANAKDYLERGTYIIDGKKEFVE